MSIVYEERPSESPYLETVTYGRTVGDATLIRPAEIHWHMVLCRGHGKAQLILVGPWSTAGVVSVREGAEILWLKFKLGTFMPHLPTKELRDMETVLPGASNESFWLNSSAWRYPNFENADAFVDALARQDVLVRDRLVDDGLRRLPDDVSPRTLRHHFLQATGLTRRHIHLHERAQRAARLLQQGASILDAVHEAGYFDQPHLTRSLKRFVGHTPAQLSRPSRPG